jgi:hypothetical protein
MQRLVSLRFLVWKARSGASAAPSSASLKLIVAKFSRGDVRGALNQVLKVYVLSRWSLK